MYSLPLLADEEILKYRDQIQSCVSEADQVKDGELLSVRIKNGLQFGSLKKNWWTTSSH